jgi:hypothetical protein
MYRVLVLYLPPKDLQASREYFEDTHIPLAAKLADQRTMRYSFEVVAAERESPYFGVMEAEFRRCRGLGHSAGVRQSWQTFPITPRAAPSS